MRVAQNVLGPLPWPSSHSHQRGDNRLGTEGEKGAGLSGQYCKLPHCIMSHVLLADMGMRLIGMCDGLARGPMIQVTMLPPERASCSTAEKAHSHGKLASFPLLTQQKANYLSCISSCLCAPLAHVLLCHTPLTTSSGQLAFLLGSDKKHHPTVYVDVGHHMPQVRTSCGVMVWLQPS